MADEQELAAVRRELEAANEKCMSLEEMIADLRD